MRINYSKTMSFLGRNGMFKQSGLYVEYADLSGYVYFEPITSKGQAGRGYMEIPIADVPALIESLQGFIHLEPKKETVTVLTIDHRHGTNTYACRNDEVANDELYKYVETWWDELTKNGKAVPLPKDHDKAIELYFDKHPDEFYTIESPMEIITEGVTK